MCTISRLPSNFQIQLSRNMKAWTEQHSLLHLSWQVLFFHWWSMNILTYFRANFLNHNSCKEQDQRSMYNSIQIYSSSYVFNYLNENLIKKHQTNKMCIHLDSEMANYYKRNSLTYKQTISASSQSCNILNTLNT